MAVLQRETPKGRDFTAEELIGRQIRVECPTYVVPTGRTLTITADGEQINNACKLVLTAAADAITEMKLTLYRFDWATEDFRVPPTEEITLQDNIEASISAIVSEVQ
jgi:hypothetical protein